MVMPNVNDDGLVHTSFVEVYASPTFPDARFWPYDGGPTRKTLTKAIEIIQNNIFNKIASCNTYFTGLPGGRTFDAVWTDPAFWINLEPRASVNFWGITASFHPMEIAISQPTFAKGAWFTAATIVHEMAHLNGAPAGVSLAAERSLLKCGLAKLYTGAVGDRRDYADLQNRNRYA
jgi:hypothetical protein